MKKAILFARVSTRRQEEEGLSLENIQVPRLEEYAKEKDLEIVERFVFQESADRKIRKRFTEVMEYMKNHDDVEAIIAFRVDRVTRNYRDAVAMDSLRVDLKKELHFVDDRLVLTYKSSGRDIQDWDLKVFIAKQTINRLKDDAQNTIRTKLSRGETPNTAPYGYKNVTLDDGRKWVEKDPFENPIVSRAFELYIKEIYSYATLAKQLRTEFGVNIQRSQVERILCNPFYAGFILSDGKEYPHHYELTIDYDEYQLAKDIRTNKRKVYRKYDTKPFVFRGTVYCKDCGCLITPEVKEKHQKNGNIHQYKYYHCTNSKKEHRGKVHWVREEEMNSQVANILKGLVIPDEQVEWLKSSLRDSHEGKKEYIESKQSLFESEIRKYGKRLEVLYEDKLDGSITREQYQELSEKYSKKQKEFERKLANLLDTNKDYYDTACDILDLASRAYELYLGSELDEKREILNLLFQDLYLKDEKLVYKLNKPFDSILVCNDQHDWLREKDSNLQPTG